MEGERHSVSFSPKTSVVGAHGLCMGCRKRIKSYPSLGTVLS